VYVVEEDTEALLYGSRVFHLCKLSDGEVYEVYLGRDDRCTCKAGQVGLRCKHTEAMRSLMATGSLDGGHDADAMATAHGPALPVIG
ncbi:MAG: hypothetical protein LC104_19175, partial [Bacteroidales bacterium]|nr:hypothetical protein [Bacteroidales bacterium]